MINSTDFRTGLTIEIDGGVWQIVDFQHVKPGKGPAFVRTKLKNLENGRTIDNTFTAGVAIEPVRVERRPYQYLYEDDMGCNFMHTETFEQIHLTRDILGDGISYLIPQLRVTVEFHEGKPLSVELPATVDLTVVETEPGLRGATVSNVTKPAKLETGLVVQVPPFISTGEKIRVNTSEGTYQERA